MALRGFAMLEKANGHMLMIFALLFYSSLRD
jgi:hypothetical protein